MNHIYRVIWSKVRNAWVVASELATSGRKEGGAGKPAARSRSASDRCSPANNATAEGRARNRRVMMSVLENPGNVAVEGGRP